MAFVSYKMTGLTFNGSPQMFDTNLHYELRRDSRCGDIPATTDA